MINPPIRHVLSTIFCLLLGAALTSNLWAAKPINSGEQFPEVLLQLTKIHNDDWDKAEVDNFVRHVIGKNLDSHWDFDPKVDAVTGATMTSVIIFDDLGKGHMLLEELHKEGLLEP